ncbi:MAG: D-erythronate dehydrogenase [Verrucomicrobiales bacterium]
MKIVITGGGGFLGNQLARAIAQRPLLRSACGGPQPVDSLQLFDQTFSAAARAGLEGIAEFVTGDIADRNTVFSLIDRDEIGVFHLASVISGDGEQDFDRCLEVNLDGGRHVFEACRARASAPRIVFVSSLAAFGGDAMPRVVSDLTKPNPETTYGMTKFIGEMMINDYSRRGFIDGRAARLPTIFIRPGAANSAASSFASGIFREPLNGEVHELPVGRDQQVPLLGYRSVVRGLVQLYEASPEKLGTDRAFNLPSTTYTIREMATALENVAARHGIKLGPVIERPSPEIQRIVASWPTATDSGRAEALGLSGDTSLEEVIEGYIEDFL